jgi:hypothetical protein
MGTWINIMKTFIFILALIFCHDSYAQYDWSELNLHQQRLLLPFKSEWHSLDETTRKKLVNNTDKWLNMSQSEKKHSYQNLRRFKQLSIEQQKHLKNKVKQFKQLSKQEQEQLTRSLEHYQQLSPKEKQRLRRKFNHLSVEQRKRHNQQGLKKFISEFDIELRQPIAQMIRNMPVENRKKLRHHMHNLNRKQKHELTLKLLAMNDIERVHFFESLKNN